MDERERRARLVGESAASLDPADWSSFRELARQVLDAAIDRMETAGEGRVWTPFPDDLRQEFRCPLPETGAGPEEIAARLQELLPFGVGNTHPRFFGWVHGSGTPLNLLADIIASAMNANTGGRDHGSIYVERQVIAWCRDLFGFPDNASGLLVSGTSIATLIALKVARDAACGFQSRKEGLPDTRLVGYASSESHACNSRAFDILGLGSQALRRIPVTDAFRMDTDALLSAIAADREAGLQPFVIIANAGSVNTGAIDPIGALSEVAESQRLWLHVDGAFGAMARLAPARAGLLSGIERADSLAFDFHKWLHVNYDAGCVLVRDGGSHLSAFSERPDYLRAADRGLSGANPWPVEYGPELSRGNRALKVWSQIAGFGTRALGECIENNCLQAEYLGRLVLAHPRLELLAPVSLNICCLRYVSEGMDDQALDRLNEEIVILIQESGVAVPSETRLRGRVAIRVNLTNHRTRTADLDLLLGEIIETGDRLARVLPR